MDVIDIDTDQLTSDLSHHVSSSSLAFTSLSRSSSQLSNPPLPPPPFSSVSPLPPSNGPFNFQPSELDEHTFYVPPTSLHYQQTGQSIPFPTFDRGLSSLSTSSLPWGQDGDAAQWNLPMQAPYRGETGSSLVFEEPTAYHNGSGQRVEGSGYEQSSGGNINGGHYPQQAAHMFQAAQPLAHQQQQLMPPYPSMRGVAHPSMYATSSPQAPHLHPAHHLASAATIASSPHPSAASPSPYPNLNLDLAPQPVVATTLTSSDYDPTRKRQRGDEQQPPASVHSPYFIETATPVSAVTSSSPPSLYQSQRTASSSSFLPSSSPSLGVSMSAPNGVRVTSSPVTAIPAAIPSSLPSPLVASPALSSSTQPELPVRIHTAPSLAALSSSSLAQQVSATPSTPSSTSSASPVAPGSPSSSADPEHKEQQKKVKHQLTDRQRRAKIKESMDQLKALVPLDSHQKADQATIVAESVDMIKGMKDELTALRQRIAELELGGKDNDSQGGGGKQAQPYTTSPFSAMMASLNGAGVSMWRMGLDGRVLEVNLVFEMVTGFSGVDVINRSPCSAPLYGSLSVMPKSFLRYFSTVSAAVSSPMLDGPASPSTASTASNSSDELPPPMNAQRVASSVSPLFSNVTISSLPIVPHSELQSFFPFKCKTLPDPSTSASSSPPLPHGQYLMNHLSTLPPNHVLKLLSRVSTSYGDTLESIQTMTLVRTREGAPDYILCLTTPDGRRLVKPTKFLANFHVQGQQAAEGVKA